MTKKLITKEMWVEEILEKYPTAQEFLSKKNIVCVMCGEPVWGSLEELMQEKDFTDEEIETTIDELNRFVSENPEDKQVDNNLPKLDKTYKRID